MVAALRITTVDQMHRKKLIELMACVAFGAAVASASVAAQPSAHTVPKAEKPSVERLDDGRLRVGSILVDKDGRRFEVPARVNRHEPPLEYLAVSKGGYKAYESLLELDASAIEFNLACILIGLDAEGARLPRFQFDTEPVTGQQVTIEARWTVDDEPVTAPAAALMTVNDKPARGPWVYIGSRTLQDGTYEAQQIGAVIGFVHDPASVLEHPAGLGIGDYGAVAANTALAPPIDATVVLTVAAIDD